MEKGLGELSFVEQVLTEVVVEIETYFFVNFDLLENYLYSVWVVVIDDVERDDFETGVNFENHTSHPSRGDVILYPGGFSETEILLAYGSACFASRVGQLAGNHFLTIVKGVDNLNGLGELALWEGAQDITFEKL